MRREQISVGVFGGGLAAGLSLLHAGFDVHVYERAGVLSEVGAGIQVSPNASRVLHGLGLGDELARMGVRPLAFHQRRWDDGRTLLRAPLGDTMVEAFDFPHYQAHRADLLNSLVGAMPADRLHVGHRFASLVDHGDRVEVRFTNGAVVDVGVLVGADGIHSDVRAVWGLFERPPLPRWSSGRVTLLGDACHAMLPFMAQGAAQGLEDGATLTACLVHGPDVPTALRRYEALRLPRASRIQAISSENKIRFHLPDGPEQRERDARMAGGSTGLALKAVEWIYSHGAGRVEDAVRV